VAPDTKRASARSICDRIAVIPDFLTTAVFWSGERQLNAANDGALLPACVDRLPKFTSTLSTRVEAFSACAQRIVGICRFERALQPQQRPSLLPEYANTPRKGEFNFGSFAVREADFAAVSAVTKSRSSATIVISRTAAFA
jgi:hypothetical protein